MIPPELCANIRRLFYAEHWRVGTIATTLGVHHDTVQRAIERDRFVRTGSQIRPSMLDPYKAFITATLEQYPAAARHPAVLDAPRSRLRRLGPASAALCADRPARRPRRGVLAPRDIGRRAGPSGLGELRPDPDRPRPALAVVLRPRAVLVPRGLRALRPRSNARELSARARRGLQRRGRGGPDPAL
jgi:hypothetical protein